MTFMELIVASPHGAAIRAVVAKVVDRGSDSTKRCGRGIQILDTAESWT
jgi:hypothetical protein